MREGPVRADPPAIRRLCLAVDVESYSRRSRPEQLDVQNRLLWAMVQACRAAGVKPARCDRQDSGDGQILILPAGIDESAVLPSAVLGLLTALHRVNHPAGSGGRIRLRVSIGQGAIQVGATGFVAPAVVTVCRLLNSDELRAALAASPGNDAAFIVMADLYHDMFAQGYGGLPAQGFSPVHVSQPAKGFAADAWIQVPGRLPAVAAIPAYPDDTELQHRQLSGGVLLDLGAAAAVAWALFAGSRGGHEDSSPAGDHRAEHHAPDHGTADHSAADHNVGDHAAPDHDIGDHGTSDHGEPGHLGPDHLHGHSGADDPFGDGRAGDASGYDASDYSASDYSDAGGYDAFDYAGADDLSADATHYGTY